MKVKDLMSANGLTHCTLETKLQNVAKIMKDANYGSLPILDKNDKVIGMVTDRDVCLSLATKAEKPIGDLSVKDAVVNPKVYAVRPEDPLTHALQEMRKNKIGRLPVTDNNGKLKGVLSVNKILSHSIVNKESLGHVTSVEENLAKTITAIVERNEKSAKKGGEAIK